MCTQQYIHTTKNPQVRIILMSVIQNRQYTYERKRTILQ
jgi:hypothetical protein